MTLDIAKFHRTCPIHPEHKPWFVTQGDDGFYSDHVCPFGCSSSSSNAGMISNAGVDIWTLEEVRPIVKYEDDLAIFRFPSFYSPPEILYPYDRSSALDRIAPLQIPWHPDKGQDFSSSFTYLGFLWDIDNKLVSLPEPKRLKFLNRTSSFIASFSAARCPIIDVMKIHGSLCHIAFVYPNGRSRLSSLSNFIASFKGDTFIRRYPPRSAISDLLWWKEILSNPNVTRPLVSKGPPIDLGLFVDASTSWGIGIMFAGKWDAWRLLPNWSGPSRDIGWLEGVALELLIYLAEEHNLSDTHLKVHSDNTGVITAFDKGRS